VFVPEEPLPGQASAVVQLSVGQDAQQSRLAGVDVANHGATDLHEVLNKSGTVKNSFWIKTNEKKIDY
jgi:hypothetical protein